MPYNPPIDEYRFIFRHVVDLAPLFETQRFSEFSLEDVDDAMGAAATMVSREILPLQRSGDLKPAKLENGIVRTSPGFENGYKAISEGGWVGMSADPSFGGLGFPCSVRNAVNEMINGGCMSLGLNPMLTQCQIDALEHHASPDIKATYLPKLVSGEWSGTMNITEPHAGSDVGSLRTRAVPADGNSFLINGQKIFISWADSDLVPNVCHLVLARLPGSPGGSKGLSLFLVPKFIPDSDGRPGIGNRVRIASLENKLGIHGSPTAVVEFDDAKGWLIGHPNSGLAAMFTMMNNARLGVGLQGVGVGEAAYQSAREFAFARSQGRPLRSGGSGTIVDHANVRRVLATMKARLFAARAICARCSLYLDLARAEPDTDWKGKAAILVPIAKAFGSDTGVELSLAGLQLQGGAGYIEDTGASQYLRDSIVATIYEGTNGIQALELVGRKLGDGGRAILDMMNEIANDSVRYREREPVVADALSKAVADQCATTTEIASANDMESRNAGAESYLRALALVFGGHCHLLSAARGGEDRRSLARVFARRILPFHAALLADVRSDADDLFGFGL